MTQPIISLQMSGEVRSEVEYAIGIDLGTTNSLAAAVTHCGSPETLADPQGRKIVPSTLCFPEGGDVLVGWPARERALSDPEATVFSVKRLMGKSYGEVAGELNLLPYQVVPADGGIVKVKVGGREMTPQELSAFILKQVKKNAEERLGGPVSRAVVTVPAWFDDSQRQATRDAGRIAGLDVLRIINEPTAAALAYGLDQKKEGLVAVYDLGGGTFDVSILQIEDGVFKTLATRGDTFLGGDDFDRILMRMVLDDPASGLDASLARDPKILQGLRQAAERAKMELSEKELATLEFEDPDRNVKIRRPIARADFERAIDPLLDRTIEFCRQAAADAGVDLKTIDAAVLVGGSTRIPRVRERVADFFKQKPFFEHNPDEVVALGAAIQAHVLTGGFREILLLDVIPLSLGIETVGGAVTKLILRNSTIPSRAVEEFTTFADNQTGVDINIFQGEREMAKDCRSLGRFKLAGIPPMPAGLPRIKVTFLVDANGILTVSAAELRSGREMTVEVQPSHGLTDEQVEAMLKESFEKAAEDFAARRLIELRAESESVLRHAAKSLERSGDMIRPEERAVLRDAMETLKEAAGGGDADALQRALEAMNQAAMPLAEALMDGVALGMLQDKTVDEALRES